MHYRILSIMILLMLVAGCATMDPPPLKQETSFFLARYDKVWATTLNELEKQSIPVLSTDKKGGVINTGPVTYSIGEKAHNELEEIAYKPEVLLGLYTHVRYGYSIHIVPSGEMSTQIKVAANIEAFDQNITHKWHSCISKNVVERTLLDKIRADL